MATPSDGRRIQTVRESADVECEAESLGVKIVIIKPLNVVGIALSHV